MDLATGIRIALRALGRNKMRTALTMLSISIGVGSYICSVAIGKGASSQIEDQIHNLGDNMIWIEAGARNVNGVRTGTHGTKSLTLEDARAIQQQIPLVVNVSPHVDTNVQLVYQNQNWFTMVRGVAPEYLAVRSWRVVRGSFFSQEAVIYGAKFCVPRPNSGDQFIRAVSRIFRARSLVCCKAKGNRPLVKIKMTFFLCPSQRHEDYLFS